MPTFAKLAAAVVFAIAGYWAGTRYNAMLPENIALPRMPLGMLALGMILGWRSMGPAAGRGYRDSLGYGLRTSVLTAFLAIFLVALIMMLRKSTGQMYRSDPFAAVLDVPALMSQYGQYMLTPPVLLALGLGGVIGGLCTEYVARRWR